MVNVGDKVKWLSNDKERYYFGKVVGEMDAKGWVTVRKALDCALFRIHVKKLSVEP